METLYRLFCLSLRSFERWQNNRSAGFKQCSSKFKRVKTNKSQKSNTYNERQLVTTKGQKNSR
jgi:hypothetical protein